MKEHVQKKMQKALFYLNANRYEEAKKGFREVLELDPEDRFAQNMLLACMLNTPTPTHKLEEISKSILSVNANESLAHLAMGKVYQSRFDYEKAKECFKAALSLQPDNIDYICSLALVLWNDKKRKEALELIDKAIAIDPESITALTYKSHFSSLSQKVKVAKENIEKALAKDPMNWLLHAHCGKVALLSMDYQSAQKRFKEAIRLNPHNPDIKDDYLNSLLAKNIIFRFLFSQYWTVGYISFAVRPIFTLMLVMMMTFYSMEHPSVSAVMTLLYGLIVFSFLMQCLIWIAVPIFHFLKSLKLWGTYYREFWSHEIFVQTNIQLALLAISYFWFTGDFRGVISAAFLSLYSFLLVIVFLTESKKLKEIYIITFVLIYSCAGINLVLDLFGIRITPVEMVASLGWLFIVFFDGFFDWARGKWSAVDKYFKN